ncbi:MAG: 1,2-phenylacetyl-CoA epoxidase subunit PaaD [Granulosicoccus sp.]
MKPDNEHVVERFFNLPSRSVEQERIHLASGNCADQSGDALAEHHATEASTNIAASIETIWLWLSEVPDPEIPVISLVELGVIRNLEWKNGLLLVTITPTYTGCPANRVIQQDIAQQLRKNGINLFSLVRQLSPAWTTNWISDSGREKLRAYGIAPPQLSVSGNGPGTSAVSVTCPRCNSVDTRKVSQFGSTPCKASYQCNKCLEPFDYFKCL